MYRSNLDPTDLEHVLGPDRANLGGRRIFITGGASGIGEGCVRYLAAAGAYVVIADRNEDAGCALEQEINSSLVKPAIKFVVTDVSSWESQLSAFQAALQFLPGTEIDSLITCAGAKSSPSWQLHPVESEALSRSHGDFFAELSRPSTTALDTNLVGTMYSVHIATTYCMGAANRRSTSSVPQSEADAGKSVVLLCSTAGFRPLEGKIDYSVAKWGVRGLFRNLRTELPGHGIRVNLVAPFWIRTALTKDELDGQKTRGGVKWGRIEDVVTCIVRMIMDPTMSGRAFSITAKGLTDLHDDHAGRDAGVIMSQLVREGQLPAPKE